MESKTIKIKDGDRDISVRIESMNEIKAEEWMLKVAFLIGAKLDPNAGSFTPSAIISLVTSIGYDKAKPLLDELLSCCYLVQGKTEIKITGDMPGMFYRPTTILRLRIESLKHNFGFFFGGDDLSSLVRSITGQTADEL